MRWGSRSPRARIRQMPPAMAKGPKAKTPRTGLVQQRACPHRSRARRHRPPRRGAAATALPVPRAAATAIREGSLGRAGAPRGHLEIRHGVFFLRALARRPPVLTNRPFPMHPPGDGRSTGRPTGRFNARPAARPTGCLPARSFQACACAALLAQCSCLEASAPSSAPGGGQIILGRSGSGAMLTKTWTFADAGGACQLQGVVVDVVRRTVTESWETPAPHVPPGKGKGQAKKAAPPQQRGRAAQSRRDAGKRRHGTSRRKHKGRVR